MPAYYPAVKIHENKTRPKMDPSRDIVAYRIDKAGRRRRIEVQRSMNSFQSTNWWSFVISVLDWMNFLALPVQCSYPSVACDREQSNRQFTNNEATCLRQPGPGQDEMSFSTIQSNAISGGNHDSHPKYLRGGIDRNSCRTEQDH